MKPKTWWSSEYQKHFPSTFLVPAHPRCLYLSLHKLTFERDQHLKYLMVLTMMLFSKKKKNDSYNKNFETKHIGKFHPAWLKTLIGLFMKKKQTKCAAPPVKSSQQKQPNVHWMEFKDSEGKLIQPIHCCCCFRQVILWFSQTNNTLHLSEGTN